ncbi:tetratricopeptide repeat protein [Chroococcidiopsis sp. CCMEE 29]|uniref:tetratricopeptide repeat protein n=1 Tax=Chroococcidiopsis sp. CCMEE 29 TaxID=155894 RepID=UPI00202036B8|nr:tetratricopeptide repeat protein [Chroococcidiopsis sp. CCMEE 29]
MSSETLEIARTEFQAGKAAFERGQYRKSVQHLEKASALVPRNSRFGGEVQTWLVTAYEAAGQTTEAIALCQQLKRHPDPETSKQGRRLLYILQAPQLKRPAEWLTQIPDLGTVADNEAQIRLGSRTTTSNRSPQQQPLPEPVDLSQVNTRDNRFIWAALIAIGLTLAGLVWWSF